MRTHERDRRVNSSQERPQPISRSVNSLVAVGKAEMLADLGDTIQFIFRQVFRQSVAAVVGEIESLG